MQKKIPFIHYFFILVIFTVLPNLAKAQNCQALISVTGNTSICQGGQVKLTASPVQRYLWSTGATTREIFASSSGNYSVAVTDNAGCTANSAPVPVTVLNAPDAALQDTIDNFTNCTYSLSSANFNLTVENISQTKATNTQYAIEWGDGQISIFGNNFSSAQHTYSLPGSFQLKLTVTNAAGCKSVKTYLVFNGSNPSFGVASQGNTNDCAPATFTFDIINTQNNTPSTVYTFQFDDGTPAQHFTHATLPKTLTHTFTKPADGKPGNAFTLTAYATNPCGTTPATVGGIRISSTPKADFTVNPDSVSCVNSLVTLTDLSESGFNANTSGQNVTSYLREWKISPATGWSFVSGSANAQQPVIKFTQIGSYTIKLIVTPRGAGVKCHADSIAKTITIQPEVKAAFKLAAQNGNCTPVIANTQNRSEGIGLHYLWQIFPKTGWSFSANSDSVSANPQFTFTKEGNYKISLTTTNLCGQQKTTDTTLVINSVPAVKLPSTQTYCLNQSVVFGPANPAHAPTVSSSSAVTAYSWSVLGNGAQFMNGSTSTSQYPELLFSTAGTYQVLFQAANACGFSVPDTQTVIITPMPTVSAGPDTTFCAQTATVFLKGFPAGGSWSGNSAVTSDGKFNASVAGTYVLTYTYGQGNCQLSAQKQITIQDLPTVSVNAAGAICPGDFTTLVAQGNAVRYEWYDAPVNGNLLAVGANFTTPKLQTSRIYYLNAFNTNGCRLENRFAITVPVKPMVDSAIVTNIHLCGSNQTATLAASGAADFEWYDLPANGNLLHRGPSFTTPTLYTTTNYYVQAISPDGCRSFFRTKATVFVVPVLTNNSISGKQAICADEIPQLINCNQPVGGNGTYQFVWESSTDSLNYQTISGATNLNFQPGPLTQTTWFRRKVTSGVCQDYSEIVKITVFPLPVIPVIASQTICYSGSATLQATGSNLTFKWYDLPTGGQLIYSGSTFHTPALQSTTDYFVQAINAEGCLSPSRGKVTVSVLPQISNNNVSGNQAVCTGDIPAVLTGIVPTGGNGSFTYLWESSTNGQVFTAASGTNTGATYQPGALTQTTWFRRLVSSGPCLNQVSKVIEITVTPAITNNQITVQPQQICSGAIPTILNASQPAGGIGTYAYVWQYSTSGPNSGFVTAGGNYQSISYAPAALYQTTWFRRLVISGSCTQPSPAIKIEVMTPLANNLVAASQSVYAGNVPALFSGTTPTGGSGTYTYEWEVSNTGSNGNFISAGFSPNYQPTALSQTSWFRRIARSGDCELISNVIEITVIPAVSNNIIQQDQIICQNLKPDVLIGSAPVGGTGQYAYLWESSTISGSAGFVTASGQATNPNYAPAALMQTTWFRRSVVSGAYSDKSNVIQITVNPGISNNVISGNQTICAGESPAPFQTTQPVGGNGTYHYRWESSTTGPATGFISAMGTNQKATYHPGALQQTTWFRRVVSAGYCDESYSKAIEVTVNTIPSPSALPAVTICAHERATFILPNNRPASDNSVIDFEWFDQAIGGQLLAKGSVFQTEQLQENKTYYVQIIKDGCVSKRTAAEVFVRKPTADAGEDFSIITGRSAYLQAKGGVSYKWSPAEDLDNPNIARPTARPAKSTTYQVEVISENGCTSIDEVTVTVLPKIAITNTFSPNRDGLNDTWEIPGLREYVNCRVEIFNRWGQKVYSSVGYPKGWNGVSASGEELPVATYYYMIYLNQEEAPLAGSITIIR